MALTLIGLGMNEEDITIAAAKKIAEADLVIVKTRLNGCYGYFEQNNIDTISLDGLFSARNFDTLCKNISRRVYSLSRGHNAVYCVEGSVNEDNACKLILSRHPSVGVIMGVSKAESAAVLARVPAGYTTASAYDIKDMHPNGSLIVYDLDNPIIASEVKLRLMEIYGDECPIVVVDGDNVRKRALFELDRLESYSYKTRVVVMPKPFLQRDAYTFDDLVTIVSMLRGEGGCPWDRAQTHESIRINAVEETYEMIDAIDRDDDERLIEELGDVLLQVVFHIKMGNERGALTLGEVTTGICKKLISRHTHIFFGEHADNAAEALDLWEKNKRKEHGFSLKQAVTDVPLSLPAAMRAQKLQKRAAKADGKDMTKEQSLAAVRQLAEKLVKSEKEELMRDSGDFLFECVRLVRLVGGDAEEALMDKDKSFADGYLE